MAEPSARRSGLRLAIFSCTGGILRESGWPQAEGQEERESKTRAPAALPFAVFALLAAGFLESLARAVRRLGARAHGPLAGGPGRRLYRDVEFHHGPLAPFLGAASDRLFGRSLPARTALAAAIALLHSSRSCGSSRRMLPPGRAALAVSIAVAAAIFLRPGGWLFPFSFDAALAVAAMTWALELAARRTRSRGRSARRRLPGGGPLRPPRDGRRRGRRASLSLSCSGASPAGCAGSPLWPVAAAAAGLRGRVRRHPALDARVATAGSGCSIRPRPIATSTGPTPGWTVPACA